VSVCGQRPVLQVGSGRLSVGPGSAAVGQLGWAASYHWSCV